MIRKTIAGLTLLTLSVAAWGQGQQYQLRVDGLACAYCAYGIEKAFMNTEGVEHVDIEFEQGLVIVDTGPDTRFDEKQLEAITRDAGFTLRSWKRVDAP